MSSSATILCDEDNVPIKLGHERADSGVRQYSVLVLHLTAPLRVS